MLKILLAIFVSLILAPLRAASRWVRYCTTPPSQDKHFSREVVLVTGGAQGIGRLIATNFALTGATIVLWDIQEQRLGETLGEMRTAGHEVHGYRVDVSDLDQLLTGYEWVKQEVGQVTVLVNNAGIVSANDIFEISLEQFEMVTRVNLISMVSCIRVHTYALFLTR